MILMRESRRPAAGGRRLLLVEDAVDPVADAQRVSNGSMWMSEASALIAFSTSS